MSHAKTLMRIRKFQASHGRMFGPSTETIGNETVSNTLLKQASRGNAAAQYRLACCYADGNDVRQDEVTACKWFESAAEAGHVPAIFRLGKAHLYGSGVDQNRVRGLYLLLQAAKRGNLAACALMGDNYLHGKFLPKSECLAFKWFRVATNRGCTRSMLLLGHCYKYGLGVEESLVKSYVFFLVSSARSDPDDARLWKRRVSEKLTAEQYAEVLRLSDNMLKSGVFDL